MDITDDFSIGGDGVGRGKTQAGRCILFIKNLPRKELSEKRWEAWGRV